MCADIIIPLASSVISSSIGKLLKKSEPNLFEIKQIVINGTSDTIYCIIHFIRSSKNKKILLKIFKKKNIYKLEKKDYKIKITNSLGHDVTRDIVEYEATKILIPFEKFFNLSDRRFIIDIRGRFREKYRDIFIINAGKEPITKNEQRIVYRTKIVVLNKKYDVEELTFVSIPFQQILTVDFVGQKLLTSLEAKAFRHLNKGPKGSLLNNRRKTQLKQKWGFDPEKLNVAISLFLRALEESVKRRFRELIVVNSETHDVQVTKMDLEFDRVQQGLPIVSFRPTICFDYSNKESNVIDITISLNREAILKIVTKLWRKFKSPKRTAPKKTLR